MNEDQFPGDHRPFSGGESLGGFVIVLAFLISAGVTPRLAASTEAKRHPMLADPAKAKCATCHTKVLAGLVKHAPTENCTSCHTLSKGEAQTTVTLADRDPALCLTCHGGFEKFTEAGEKKLAGAHPPVADGCTGCHDPHSSASKKLLKKLPPGLCIDCHAADDLKKAHPVSVDKSNCLACHAPHGSAQKQMMAGSVLHPPFAEKSCDACHAKGVAARRSRKKGGGELCLACHDLGEPPAGGSLHGAVQTGLCTGCHDPHMSDRPKLLKKDGPSLCTGCHAPIAALLAGASVHPPATEDCTGCHAPHQSAGAKLLSDSVPALCLNCHDAGDKPLRGKHLDADFSKLACLACHNPHGSNEKHLLAAGSVHPPFGEGSCDSCHADSKSTAFNEKKKNDICAACHDIAEKAQQAKVPHPALESADCVDCHSPHASKQERLVRSAGAGPCADCHGDQVAGEGESQHGAILRFGCRACHEPHGGDHAKLLRIVGNDLCIGCHEPRSFAGEKGKETVLLLGRFAVPKKEAERLATLRLSPDGRRNHPVADHPVIGSVTGDAATRPGLTWKGELSCLTCHDPHKGASKKILRWGVKDGMSACLKCHTK